MAMKSRKTDGLLAVQFDKDIRRHQPDPRIKVEWIRAAALRPAPRNARTHSKKQLCQIARSIKQFGFVVPIVVDKYDRIIAGHGRLEAAKLLGLSEVPVIRISHLTEPAVRALALADNRLAEKAGWNRELLAIELEELSVLLPQLDLDLSITGFEPAEIDTLMVDLGSDRPDPADELPERNDTAVISKTGDLFVLGRHRLYVGDARVSASYGRLMQSHMAAMAFNDPPYNVPVAGHVGGRGLTQHREFVCASGEMTQEQFIAFLEQCLKLCAQHSVDGAIHYVCIDWRHIGELLAAGAVSYTELKNLCVWVKSNAGQGTFYRSQHELVAVFKHGTAPHLNTFELGQHGPTRSDVWQYAGINTFRSGRMNELKMHPTVKPTALVVDAMRDCSRRGDIILDVFAGSGTTIMAADQIGRRAFCMEIDPIYADVCIRRWQAYTRQDASLETTGETFDDLTSSRAGGAREAPAIAAEPGNPKRQRRVLPSISQKRKRPPKSSVAASPYPRKRAGKAAPTPRGASRRNSK